MCLVDYSNVNWEGDLDECKSTFGYAFLLNNSVISWKSKKKGFIALPTMEAKLIACSVAIQEVVRLRSFLQSLRIIIDVFEPLIVYNVN